MPSKTVTIIEVGPRDGLQNEPTFIPTEVKLDFIRELSTSGLQTIEATAFVSPQWVPQMTDHKTILDTLPLNTSIRYPVLVPNQRGLENAIQCGVKDIAVFTAASNTFSEKNTHCNIEASLSRIDDIMTTAHSHNIRVRAYISCVLGCPYEGDIIPSDVCSVARHLNDLGITEISLGDTIGNGTPASTERLLDTILKNVSADHIAVHFHDTQGRAIDNIQVALDAGIRTIDSSAGGLGGCPYAPGAAGNVATEDVINLLDSLGYQHGINQRIIQSAAKKIHVYIQDALLARKTPNQHKKKKGG